MKKVLFIILFLTVSFPIFAIPVNGWNINVIEPTVHSSFIKEQDVETYTGDITHLHMEQKPKDGYVYVLVPLVVKRESSKLPFQAQQIRLQCQNTFFERVENDSFLVDYDILPFTHLVVNLGKYKGNLLFEIPKEMLYKNPTILFNKTPLKQIIVKN